MLPIGECRGCRCRLFQQPFFLCAGAAAVKRRSGAAHIPPMNETTGTISLDTLKRSVHWVDRYGNQHALTDMTQDYLQNTLAHLRRMGSALYSLELKRREREVLLAEMTGAPPASAPQQPWDGARGSRFARAPTASLAGETSSAPTTPPGA
jgi:hypothetical protein